LLPPKISTVSVDECNIKDTSSGKENDHPKQLASVTGKHLYACLSTLSSIQSRLGFKVKNFVS
jgi:hypothetical protein